MPNTPTVPTKPSRPRRHGHRPDDLLFELAEAQQRVQSLTGRLAAAHALDELAAPPAPACPTTGRLRPFRNPFDGQSELEVAHTLINTLVAALRPFSLIREMRVIDIDRDPKTVCDITVPIGASKQVDQALNLYASYLRADSHRRARAAVPAASEPARPASRVAA